MNFPQQTIGNTAGSKPEQKYWLASWLSSQLGYKSLSTLMPVIRKAERVSLQLNMPIEDNFIHFTIKRKKDLKLSRFACLLITLQADTRKANVKKAQNYFLKQLADIDNLRQYQEYLDRLSEREQVSLLNKLLTKRATAIGVRNYRYFQNEGYLGLYDHTLTELKSRRNLDPNDDLNDFIGILELSANIFRISMTIERLKTLRNPTEEKAAKVHRQIGAQIRQLIKFNTGLFPEEIRLQFNLEELNSRLKKAQKRINEAN